MTSRVSAPKNSAAMARPEPIGVKPPSPVDPAGEIEALRRELAATRLERDDYRQEMFESNRHAAWLSHQARDMSGPPPGNAQPDHAEPPSDFGDMPGYITYLEEKLWAAETARLEIARYVQYLEGQCWELETQRIAANDAASNA